MPDLEVEIHANVVIFISLLDLEVRAYVNVRNSTTLAIGQTTHTALSLGVRHSTAPLASGVPPSPHLSSMAMSSQQDTSVARDLIYSSSIFNIKHTRTST